MRFQLKLLVLSLSLLLVGCLGIGSRGRLVPARHVARYSHGGSLRTLWYRGSDRRYHYFLHLEKARFPYRVRREELSLPNEFSFRSRQPVFIGDEPFWRELRNQAEPEYIDL